MALQRTPRYSVCITHFNCVASLEKALGSILGQIDDSFEVVVADSLSTDGSRAVLESLAGRGKITLVEEKCSRGRGRQLALEAARGEYVISGLDMDESFRPIISGLLDFYHEKCEGNLLRAKSQGTIVAPRRLVSGLGGWRDLQYAENWDLSRRAAHAGKYRWTIFLLTEGSQNPHPERRSFPKSTLFKCSTYIDCMRTGHRLFSPGQRVGLNGRFAQIVATVASPFYTSYRGEPRGFTSNEPEYFVDSRDWWLDGTETERERKHYKALLGRDFP